MRGYFDADDNLATSLKLINKISTIIRNYFLRGYFDADDNLATSLKLINKT